MVVVDVSYVINEIAIIAEKLDGYVVSSQKWGERDRLHGAITIRVPAGDFTNVITELHKLAVEVTNEQTSSEDVTEEYVDLEAKLRNLEASELQLVKLLDKAEKVEDILGIQRELTRTRGEIDQTQGRMQYLERTSSTSLIRVTLEQAALDVIITANKKTVKEGERIQFESRIAGGFAPYSFEWDFGDEETSTDPYPIHSYKADGIYTITLKVTDDRSNSAAEIREDYIDVLPGWTAGLTASGAWKGLVTFGHVLVDIFIWLGVFSPVWIIIGGILFWWFRRKKKKIM